jgi:hypothetical protein
MDVDTVKNGYQIEFNVFPQGSSFMNEIQFCKQKTEIVSTEIDKLLPAPHWGLVTAALSADRASGV